MDFRGAELSQFRTLPLSYIFSLCLQSGSFACRRRRSQNIFNLVHSKNMRTHSSIALSGNAMFECVLEFYDLCAIIFICLNLYTNSQRII